MKNDAKAHACSLVKEYGVSKAREIVNQKIEDAPFLVNGELNFWTAVLQELNPATIRFAGKDLEVKIIRVTNTGAEVEVVSEGPLKGQPIELDDSDITIRKVQK